MSDSLLTLLITIVLFLLTVVPYYRYIRRREEKAKKKLEQMKIAGLVEATTIHPHIDALACIGCGACVRACPEGDVLAVIGGKAEVIHGAKCVGHGLCAEACPVAGITLLMAKPGRSANLPSLTENYETNIPGVFIVGELGGIGLIKNAITQGIRAVEFAATQRGHRSAQFDIAIVGAGPAGIAAGLTAKKNGLTYLILEQGDIGGTILQYPRTKIVMTSAVELPLWGEFNMRGATKEELLEVWEKIIALAQLDIHGNEKVLAVAKDNGRFKVSTSKQSYEAGAVVLAMGRRGTPRKLGVPGEGLSKVMYRLIDTQTYQDCDVLVVGGGDSAIEAAVGLASQLTNRVTLSYRKGEFARIKERNRQHLDEYVGRKKVEVVFNSEVGEILDDSVVLNTPDIPEKIKNDYVFIFAGGEMPYDFLKSIGISFYTQVID
jgi:putative YpdA family bacillithiol system oxidoreductase